MVRTGAEHELNRTAQMPEAGARLQLAQASEGAKFSGTEANMAANDHFSATFPEADNGPLQKCFIGMWPPASSDALLTFDSSIQSFRGALG